MKKILSLLSSVLLSSVSTSSVVACSSKDDWKPAEITPAHGWPPVEQRFLPIWKQFREQSQQKLSESLGNVVGEFSREYLPLYEKYKGSDRTLVKNPDSNGVPQENINKIYEHLAVMHSMYDYQMSCLRLFYTELNISYLVTGHKQVNQDEAYSIWTMKYFRSYRLFTTAKIQVGGPNPTEEAVAININFNPVSGNDNGRFSPYIPFDDDGNPVWSKPPVSIDTSQPGNPSNPRDFRPFLKLKKEYYSMINLVYKELFGGDQND